MPILIGMKHYPALDGLRGLAVALVILQHLPGVDPSGTLGYIGVDVFFALSGFLITRGLLASPNLRRFYAKRAARIIPPYAITVAAVWWFTPGEWVWWAASHATNIGYSLGRIDHLNPLSHCWSLSVEEHFYLLWPLIVVAAPRRREAWASWGVVLALAGAALLRSRIGDAAVWSLTPFRSATLLGGAMLAFHEASLPRFRTGLALAFIASLVVAWMPWHARSCLASVACVGLVVAIGDVRWIVGDMLNGSCLRGLGRVSYGVYLYHFPIFYWLGVAEGGAYEVALALAATACVVGLSWVLIERPVMSLARRA